MLILLPPSFNFFFADIISLSETISLSILGQNSIAKAFFSRTELLSPLKKIGVPVHEFSMMMTIALRFIPTLTEETQKIMNAQKARGADFSTGSLVQRAKALVPILVPLFVSAFRRADELATAMECRCYTGGEGRTRMNVLHAGTMDYMICFMTAAVGAGILFLNRFGGYMLSW